LLSDTCKINVEILKGVTLDSDPDDKPETHDPEI